MWYVSCQVMAHYSTHAAMIWMDLIMSSNLFRLSAKSWNIFSFKWNDWKRAKLMISLRDTFIVNREYLMESNDIIIASCKYSNSNNAINPLQCFVHEKKQLKIAISVKFNTKISLIICEMRITHTHTTFYIRNRKIKCKKMRKEFQLKWIEMRLKWKLRIIKHHDDHLK
jgi:hypothetical protein